MENTWYIIVNPTSGNNRSKAKWKNIIFHLNEQNITFNHIFTMHKDHEYELVFNALKLGFRKFISVGGDGTLHNIVNALMSQNIVELSNIKVAVIPTGTGNDWVKTYRIPKNIKQAVSIISNEKSIKQDIGKIEIFNTKKQIYFNNVAGLGFDGFVVKNVLKYKKYRSLAYLIATVHSFMSYHKSLLTINFDNKIIKSRTLLTLVGICSYSGGGMKLTKNANTTDGLFDISIAKQFNFVGVLLNILKFYNGKIVHHKEVETYKTDHINITTDTPNTFIQADGELIGEGGFEATIIPKAITFIIP